MKHDGFRPASGWRRYLGAFRCDLHRLSTTPRLAGAFGCSLGVWSLQLVEYASVARAVELPLPFVGTIGAMVLINAGLVLRATPAGLGYFQVAYAMAVSPFGVPTEAAVATSLLIQLVEIVPVTIAALALAPGMLKPLGGVRPRHCCS